MSLVSWRRWLKRLSPSSRISKSGRRRKQSRRLQFESLETRVVPAVRTWTGLASDNHWTDSKNWMNSTAPSPGDDLVFPGNANQFSTLNDFVTGTAFNSITFTGAGYTVSGQGIVLGTVNAGSLVDSSGGTTNSVGLNITVPGASGIDTLSASANTILTLTGQITGPSGFQLKKTGQGTVILTGNNSTFTGPITINAGALEIESPNALGSGNATTVLSGAALQVNNVFGTIHETLVLSGPGVNNNGAVENIAGSNVISGPVTFGSNLSIGADAGQLTLSGVLGDNNIGYTFTKVGPGEVILTNANVYAGPTTVAAGLLTIQNPTALGQTTQAVNVSNGASLQVEGVSVVGKTAILNGLGVNAEGALDLVSGVNASWSGQITLGSNVVSNGIGVNQGSTLTLTGVIKESNAGSGLSKEGAGTLILTTNNSYTGITEVHSGALNIQAKNALGGSSAAGVIVDGRASLQIVGVSVQGESLTLIGPGENNNGAIENVSGSNTWSGPVSLPADGSVGADVGSQLTFTGVISGPAGVTKFLPGEVFFTNANTYLGSTDVSAGILAIETSTSLGVPPPQSTFQASTTVENGAALDVIGGNSGMTVTNPLILAGPGVNASGAVDNINGNNIFRGNVILTANTSIGVESAAGSGIPSQLTLAGEITQRNGVFGFTKLGPNRLVLSGYNQYTGGTAVNAGTLNIQNDNGLGVLPDKGTVVTGGAALELQGGIHVGAEALTLSGTGIANSGALLSVAGDNLFDGKIAFVSNVYIGVDANSRLTLTGAISDSSLGYSLTESGGGILVLAGANSYQGGTQVLSGVLNLQNNSALGSGVAGTTVNSGASLEVQQGISIPFQKLTISGSGLTSQQPIPVQWFDEGPAGVNGVVPQPTFSNTQANLASGRITAIAGDPSNPNIYYVGAASGGIWKTTDAGVHWVPLTDSLSPLFIGAITVDSANPNIVYAGTGEDNDSAGSVNFQLSTASISSPSSYYGDGVLRSIDGGLTWSLLGSNHFQRQSISTVVIDPTDPTGNTVYVATGLNSVNDKGFPNELPIDPTGTGIWKTTDGGNTWTNTTRGPKGIWLSTSTPSQDDYTSFVMDPLDHNDIFAAVGTQNSDLQTATKQASYGNNAVYQSLDGGKTWALLKSFPVIDAGSFLTGPSLAMYNPALTVNNIGNIKLAIASNVKDAPLIYASASTPNPFATGGTSSLLGFYVDDVGGKITPSNWSSPGAPNFLGSQGVYDNVIAVTPNNRDLLFGGGQEGATSGIIEGAFNEAASTITWSDIGKGVDNNGPHSGGHAMSFDSTSNLLYGTDGGIWRLVNPTPPPTGTGPLWADLNQNLQITQIYGFGVNPNNANQAIMGSQDNGSATFNGNNSWTEVAGGDGGISLINPANPTIEYLEVNDPRFTEPNFPLAKAIYRSQDGGKTFSPVMNGINFQKDNSDFVPPLVIDPSNGNRLLFGTTSVYETVNGGTVWTPISTPFKNGWTTNASIDLLAVANNNPNVIYAEAGGKVFVTLNHGAQWTEQDVSVSGVTINDSFSAIQVDPNNPLIAYITRNRFDGPFNGSPTVLTGQVFRTVDGGAHWFDITGNLPDMPVWQIAIDPRPNPNILYIGTDQGVWFSTDLGKTWAQFGVGMPDTIVTQLALNQYYESLTAATYGRGVFYARLVSPTSPESVPANEGALASITGNNTWDGNITLAGAATVGADVASQLTLAGNIADNGIGASLNKVGQGIVVLTQPNTYGGPTTIAGGILIVQDSQALGINSQVTVLSGATLELQGDQLTFTENINLNGDGFNTANQYQIPVYLGALFSTNGFNTWTGNVTLDSQNSVTVGSLGAAARSGLTVTGSIGQPLPSSNANLDKQGAGLVVLTNADTYSGSTNIEAGDLNIQNVAALGTGTAGGTTVQSGAALELQFPVPTTATPPVNTIAGQALTLNGNGLFDPAQGVFDGALHSISGDNAWAGPITLFTPSSIGVDDDGSPVTLEGSPLTILGAVGDKGGQSSLAKVGAGKLILANVDSYTGGTTVVAGVLNIQNSLALNVSGGSGTTVQTLVDAGAALEVQQPSGGAPLVVDQLLTLNGTGIGGAGALDNVGGNNTWADPIILNSSSTIGVETDPVSGNPLDFTITGDITGVETSVITKAGMGTLTFPNANDYNGQTLVTNGVLQIENNQALGALGGDGTFVTSGATLELDQTPGGSALLVAGKTLQLTGTGFNRLGSLYNSTSGSGSNTWQGSIILDGAATINVAQGTSLTANRVITEAVPFSSLTLTGGGILIFADGSGGVNNSFPNNYTGTTTVLNGTLMLNKLPADAAVPGNLLIGDGTAGESPIVQLEANAQLANTSGVTVNSNGLFDLNGFASTVASFALNDGTATTDNSGSGGTLTVNGVLSLTGGTLNIAANGQVIMTGLGAGQSDSKGVAGQINGPGTLSLNGKSEVFTMTQGGGSLGSPDLVINAVITDPVGGGSLNVAAPSSGKPGVLVLTAVETYAGSTTVNGATLQVDGTLPGSVTLNGGTLAGIGTVNGITANGGTVQGGDAGPTGVGVLTSNSAVNFGRNSTFFVNLNGTTTAPPTYGSLAVAGNVNITSGALLSVAVGYSLAINDSYLILTTTAGGTLIGNFKDSNGNTVANGASLVLAGKAFQSQIPASDNSLTLVHTKSSVTLGVGTSKTPAQFGAPVTFTATVTPTVSGLNAPTGNVEFFVDGVDEGPVALVAINGKGVATLSSNSLPVSVPGGLPLSVAQSLHTVSVTYPLGDANYSPVTTPVSVSQTFTKAPTQISATFNPPAPVAGVGFALSATVATAVVSGAGTPTGMTTYAIEGTAFTDSATLSNGVASFALPALTFGNYKVDLTYAGDSNFNGISTPVVFSVSVGQAASTTAVVSTQSPSAYGQSVTFTATVSPSSANALTPTGTVNFFDGTTKIGSGTLKTVTGQQVATYTTAVLTVTTHTISAVYLGDTNFSTSTSPNFSQVVQAASTTVAVTSSTVNNTSVSGQTVTFTATISVTSPGTTAAAFPTGTVTFSDGGSQIGTGALSTAAGITTATFKTSTLSTAGHTITAVYGGDPNFNASPTSPTLTQTVNVAPTTTTVTSSAGNNISVAGQSVTFTATVTINAPGSTAVANPTGMVTFEDNGSAIGTGTLSTNGAVTTATFTISTLSVASHPITAVYAGDTNFKTSTSTILTQVVTKDATTTGPVVPSPSNPGSPIYGQLLSYSASVTANAPGSGTPTGSLAFFITVGTLTTPLGSPIPLVGGSATLPATLVPAGNNSITATYQPGSDPNFIGSTSAGFFQIVAKANSTTAPLSVDNATPTAGTTINFTTTIAAVSPGVGTPTGTVTFLDGANVVGTVTPIPANGVVVLSTSALSVGSHTISAEYNGDNNFNISASPGSPGSGVSVTVVKNTPTVTITPSAGQVSYGQSVTFTVTVAKGTLAGTGTVDVMDTFGGNTTDLTPTNLTLSGGSASVTENTTSTNIGTHTISVSYSGDGNFTTTNPPVGNITETVVKGTASVALTSSVKPSSVFGQPVTFTATLSNGLGNGGILPSNTVEFYVDSTDAGPSTINNGVATFTTSTLSVSGTGHTIEAIYNGDANFNSGAFNTYNQIVSKAGTNISTVTALPSGPSSYGTTITFSTTVSTAIAETVAPTGTVTFFDGNTSLGNGSITVNGTTLTATLATASLNVAGSPHAITAQYSGDGNYNGVTTANSLNQVITKAGTTTSTVSSSNSSPVYGQSFTLSATVTSAGGAPTGFIVFADGSNVLNPSGAVVNGSGLATFMVTAATGLLAGNHNFTATYSGDANFSGSSSANPLGLAIDQAGSTTTVTASRSSTVYGQSVTFTGTVLAMLPGVGTPTGSVTFQDGSQVLGMGTLNAGVATLATTVLPVGAQTVTAIYGSDNNFSGSTSSTGAAVTVSQAGTTTSLVTSSLTPTVFGQAVTLTATVQVKAPGSGTPTGTVTFLDNGKALVGTSSFNGVTATLTTSALAVGGHPITASYGGDSNFGGSSSTGNFIQTVNAANSQTTLQSSLNPAGAGATVTFTAVVQAVALGAGTPTGSVTFLDGATTLNSATLIGGTATYSTSTLSVATHSITASYQTDGNFASSQSLPLLEVVNKGNTTVTLTGGGSGRAIVGQSVAFTVTVSPVAPAAGTPTSTVTIIDNGTSIQTVTLPNGSNTVTVQVSFPSSGVQHITAIYNGDNNYNGSASPNTLVVNVVTQNQAFVNQVFLDLLNRPADPIGLAGWTNLINAGVTRSQVVLDIEASNEYLQDVVNSLYVKYLHRNADPTGLMGFANALANGTTIEQVSAALIGSPEYFATRGGGTNNGFLNALYMDVLNRPIDPTGLAGDLLLLQQFTPRSAIAQLTLNSLEYKVDLVNSYFEEFLHRPADPGSQGFVNALLNGTADQVIVAAIMGSQEFFNDLL